MQRKLNSPNKARIHQHNQAKFQNGFILLPVVLAITLIAAIAFLMNREGAMAVNELGGEMQTTQASLAAKAGMSHILWQSTNANCTGYTNLATTNLGNNSYSATISPTSNSPVSIAVTGTDTKGASVTIKRDRVTMYQPYFSVTLQLGTDPGVDASIFSLQSTTNFGGGDNGVMKAWIIIWLYKNQLLQFDLPTSIPATAHIVSAQLQLYQKSGSGTGNVSIHRVTQGWVEGTKSGSGTADGATWKTYDGTNAWTSNGGDYDATAVATNTVTSDSDVIASFEIAPLVQDWLTSPNTNYGMLLKAEDMLSPTFASKEDTTASKRPKLLITYTCECGKVCDVIPTCNPEYTNTMKVGQFSTSASTNITGLTYFPKGQSFNGVKAPTAGAWISVDSTTDKISMTDMSGALLTSGATPGTSATGIAYIKSGIHGGQFAVTDKGYDGITWVNNSGAKVSQTATTAKNLYGVTYIDKTASGTYDGTVAVMDEFGVVSILNQSGTLLKTVDANALTGEPQDLAHVPGKDRFLILDRNLPNVVIIDFSGVQKASYSLTGYSLSNAYGIAINPLTCDHALGDSGLDTVTLLNKNPVTTVTLNAVADTDIYEASTGTNYGTGITIYVGRNSSGKQHKGLIKFDVSSIPAGVAITSATLRLNETTSTGSGSYNIGLYKIKASWSETTATWSNFSASTNYDTTQLAVTSVATGSTGFKEWTLPVALINEWKDGVPTPNYGLALVYESSSNNNYFQFAAKENATAASRPQLVINYKTP
jgi:hypothetical protein